MTEHISAAPLGLFIDPLAKKTFHGRSVPPHPHPHFGISTLTTLLEGGISCGNTIGNFGELSAGYVSTNPAAAQPRHQACS
ncbi:MAG: hypothetical protein POG74_03610 [Acidocella sp.]|nr:hypothetical protein [Acidocella sp.]